MTDATGLGMLTAMLCEMQSYTVYPVVNAQKFIGLNATGNNILTPRKSVTAIIGLSENEISKGRRGCACCNMREVCQFRKRGDHCGF